MNKESSIFIKHILDSIQDIELFINKATKDEFAKNKEKQSAVIHQIEIIGEAAKNLPKEFKDKHPAVEWSEIIRTRDKIIHHYFGVNLETVWDIVKKNLPELKKKMLHILSQESKG